MQKTLLLLSFYFTFTTLGLAQSKICLPDEILEVSGLYAATPDSLWWHNEGEHPSELFCTDHQGKIKHTLTLKNCHNIDWEDLTHDNKGNIYIGDFGNNNNNRKDLCIYKYNIQTQQLDSIHFGYVDQTAFPPNNPAAWRFDCEAFFWQDNTLHLFTKNRMQQGDYTTTHYTLADNQREQIAQKQGQHQFRKRVVTGAAISPNKKIMALLTYDYNHFLGIIPYTISTVFYFTDFEKNNFLNGKKHQQLVKGWLSPSQYEAIDFIDDHTLIVATEKTILCHQKFKKVKIRL